MAFVSKAEHQEPEYTKLSDIPLLKTYATDKSFCKSGLLEIEHLIPPGQFQNFTLVNYSKNVRVNISPKNADSYAFLKEYRETMRGTPGDLPLLMIQITNREKGWVNVGVDDRKTCNWVSGGLGYKTSSDPL